MDSTAASASSHAACATDIPRRRAAYALYLAVDLVFAAVTLARLVRTARLSRAQHRAARDAAAQPLLDRTSPAPEPASDPATTTTISFTPKILYFSLTFSTCIVCAVLHALSCSPRALTLLLCGDAAFLRVYTCVQLLSDGMMVLTYLTVAALWGALIHTFPAPARAAPAPGAAPGTAPNPCTACTCRPAATRAVTRVLHRRAACFGAVAAVETVFLAAVALVPTHALARTVTAEHAVLSGLVCLSYVLLFAMALALARILRPIARTVPLARALRTRILALGVSAAALGVARAPFDYLVLFRALLSTADPLAVLGAAVLLRYVPCALLTALMWPLPRVRARVPADQASEASERAAASEASELSRASSPSAASLPPTPLLTSVAVSTLGSSSDAF